MRRWMVLVGVLLACVAFSGCGTVSDAEQMDVGSSRLPVKSGHSFGQTFVARHGGLTAIRFWLDQSTPVDGILRLDLLPEPGSHRVLASTEVALEAGGAPGYVSLSLAPRRDSHGTYYFARVTFEGTGTLLVGQGPAEAYRDGALYLGTEPQPAQAAFQLSYHPLWMVADLASATLRGIGAISAGVLLYVVPGYGLLALVWPRSPLTVWEKVALSVGVSLSLYPLLLMWSSTVGLHPGALHAWLPVGGGLGALAWRVRIWRPRSFLRRLQTLSASHSWADVVLALVLLLVFGARLLVVRSLDAPMWGDSYQHAVITQLMLDNGGLFETWAPYAPYRGLTVHMGFHANVAAYGWLTGVSGIDATLWGGQLLNGLAALTLVPLAERVGGRKRWPGVAVVVVAGLLSPMPAYYVNWGRYPQLAGQIILPVAIWFLWSALDDPRASRPVALLGGVCLAGMTLSYFRMPFYFLAFAVPWFVLWTLSHLRSGLGGRQYGGAVLRGLQLGLVGLLLFAPWLSQLAGSDLATDLGRSLSVEPSAARVKADYSVWTNVFWYVPRYLAGGAVVALVWALMAKRWKPVSVALWVVALGALVAGSLVGLPGAAFLNNFSVVIMLYIPLSLLIGWLLGQVGSAPNPSRWWSAGLLVLVAVTLSVVGLREQIGVVAPSFILVTRPDLRAMQWVNANTPEDARFLVESFRIYGGRSVVGADAGWWLPLFTERSNTVPPQYALLNEVPIEPDYEARVVDLVALLEDFSPNSETAVARLCQEGVTHVYVGQRAGEVGDGVLQLFEPADFAGEQGFDLVYHQDQVHIYSLSDGLCTSPEL